MRERGLKQGGGYYTMRRIKSLPMRERGLKRYDPDNAIAATLSLPMRERGLKLSAVSPGIVTLKVAPHAGAWIETANSQRYSPKRRSRSPCGSVD